MPGSTQKGGSGSMDLLLFSVGAALLIGGGAVVYTMTRGLRNNNPGNIVYSSDPSQQWVGLAAPPSDGRFCIFTDVSYGFRALGHILTNYYQNYGLNTVALIINRWAPTTENDTASYIAAVASAMGVDPNVAIDVTDPNTLASLAAAITTHENGINPYSTQTIFNGVTMA